MIIKVNSSGQIITRSGLPSCTCCGGCSCAESLEDTYLIDYAPSILPAEIVTRDSPCLWVGEWNQTPFGMQPMELRCESSVWFYRLHYSGGAGYLDVPKLDPSTASPVGDYDGGTVS